MPRVLWRSVPHGWVRELNAEYVIIAGLPGIFRVADLAPGRHRDGDWGHGERLIAAEQERTFKLFHDAVKAQVGTKPSGEPVLKGKASAWIDHPLARRLKPAAGQPAIGLWPPGAEPPGSLSSSPILKRCCARAARGHAAAAPPSNLMNSRRPIPGMASSHNAAIGHNGSKRTPQRARLPLKTPAVLGADLNRS